MNKKAITIVLSLVVVALIAFSAINYNKQDQKFLSKEEAVNKALEYINMNLVEEGANVSLAQIYDNKDAPYYIFQINIMGQLYDLMITADGSRLFTNTGIDLNEKLDVKVDGNFYFRENAEIIEEDGKPVVFLFTSSSCPYCAWEKPIMQEVVDQFEDNVVYRLREDSLEDQNVYAQYGEGGVPLIIIGGKYYRESAGQLLGEEAEKEYLTKHICELTGGIPEDVCQ